MAEALLEIVLQDLSSFVQKQIASFLNIDRDVQRLSSALTAIRSVLEDAEEKRTTNRAIQDWKRKLTDAAYILDDILDECSIITIGLESELNHNSGFADKALHCVFLPRLHPKNIWFRRRICKRMKEVGERLNEIAGEKQQLHLCEGITARRGEDTEWRQTISVVTGSQIYGREEDRERIVEFLVGHANDNENPTICPIVGIGGVGKTTLAQLVFNDARVSEHFDLKIWVCVSDDFSMRRIMESIIESATTGETFKILDINTIEKKTIKQMLSLTDSSLRQTHKTSDLELMQNLVQILLKSKRYLLVLDDVWNESQEKWERLKCVLQCGLKGSSILVTTRLANVASVMGTVTSHHLSNLSEDECWSLFKQYAFGPNREGSAELVSIGKEIVKKCRGLPLAVKTLGSLLHFKSGAKEWHYIKEKLWHLPEDESSILPALRLSYFNLKLTLRRCFAFCAIFPKNKEIMMEHLIHLWMANGFISSRGNLEVEDVGNKVWNELYQRSFFQDVKTDEFGNVISFKMHDLVHDLAQDVMGEECMVMEAPSLGNLSGSTHHLGCSNSSPTFHADDFKKVKSLRTLFEFSPSVKNYHGLPAFSSLRALRMSSSHLSSLKNFVHLRYLDLYCSDIPTLPKSICSLQKLQTLKLESCPFFSYLPKYLTRLQNLRHLVIKNCNSLSGMPLSIGRLTSLRTLSVFIVGSKRGYHLAELHDLELQGKLHIKGLENVQSGSDAEQANLIGKKELNRLYLSWGSNNKSHSTEAEKVLEGLKPHSNLRSLGIQGYEGTQLPSWMRNTSVLNNLVALTLYNCKNCQQLPPLGKLPSLKSLYLFGMDHVQHIDDDYDDCEVGKSFMSLETLNLHKLPNLERMLKGEGVNMFPLLSKLSISGVPSFVLPCLPSVEHLEVVGCNEKLLKSIPNHHNLKFLKLGGNKELISFPDGIMLNLHHLKTLHISDFTRLEVLPIELNSICTLEELGISDCCELQCFPEDALQGLSSLRTLRIENCQKFRYFSEGIQYLTSLERLEIHNCEELAALPNGMNQLTTLFMVEISGGDSNCKIPEGLECIPSLLSLVLFDFPNLSLLPDSLGDLTSLQHLSIYGCPKLRSLPTSFQRLRDLQSVHVYSCPKLETWCKNRKREEGYEIGHVPHIELQPRETFFDNIRFLWKMRKVIFHNLQSDWEYPDLEFAEMVDEL